jgi:hypothetical protein
VDLNKDGVYEFITTDPLSELPCTQPSVTTILQYDAGQGRYVGASLHFAGYYTSTIGQLAGSTQPGTVCQIYPLITTLLYLNKVDEAKGDFNTLYQGNNATADWNLLTSAVTHARFYVPGTQ